MAQITTIVNAILESKQFTDGVNKIAAGAEKAKASAKGIDAQFGKAAKGISGAYGAIAGVISGVIGAALISATKYAADFLKENQKFAQVFKGTEKQAAALRDELVNGYQLSTEEATKFLSKAQDQQNALGQFGEQATKTSGEVVKISKALEEFGKGTTEVNIETINAAFLGQEKALRSLSVSLDDNQIKNIALSKGMKLVNGEVSQQGKQMIILEAITKANANAITQFNKKEDTLADTFQQATAVAKDFQLAVGLELIAALKKPIESLNNFLGTGDRLEKMRRTVKGIIGVFTALVGIISIPFRTFPTLVFEVVKAFQELNDVTKDFQDALKDGFDLKDLAKLDFKKIANVGKNLGKNFVEDMSAPIISGIKTTVEAVNGELDKIDKPSTGPAPTSPGPKPPDPTLVKKAYDDIAAYTNTARQNELAAEKKKYEELKKEAEDNGVSTLSLQEKYRENLKAINEKYDAEEEKARDEFRDYTKTDIEKQLDAEEEKYRKLTEFAAQNGIDTTSIKEEYSKKILEIETKEVQKTLSAFSDIASSAKQLFSAIGGPAADVANFVVDAVQAASEGVAGLIKFAIAKIAELIVAHQKAEEEINKAQEDAAKTRTQIALQEVENRIKAYDEEISKLRENTDEENALNDYQREQEQKDLEAKAAAGDKEAQLRLAAIKSREEQNKQIAEIEAQKVEEEKKAAMIKKQIALVEISIEEGKAIAAVPFSLFTDDDDRQKAALHEQYQALRDLVNIQAFAKGGVTPGGISLVGEKGPELRIFNPGETILPAEATARILDGLSFGGGDSGGHTGKGQVVKQEISNEYNVVVHSNRDPIEIANSAQRSYGKREAFN